MLKGGREMKRIALFLLLSTNLLGYNDIYMEPFNNNNQVSFLAGNDIITDNGRNESTYNGLIRASKEFDIKINVKENNPNEIDYKELEKLYNDSILVMTVGPNMKKSLDRASLDLSDKYFTLIDGKSDNQNVKSIEFKDEEGAFLVGLVAGRLTKTNSVGFISLNNQEKENKYLSGLVAGLKISNPVAAEKIINGQNTRMWQKELSTDEAYNNATELYNRGCDIIFETLDKEAEGVFKAAKDEKKYVFATGVNMGKKLPEYSTQILGSLIRNIDKVTYDACKELATGTFKSGVSNMKTLGIKDLAIDFEFTNPKIIPANIRNEVEGYRNKIMTEIIKIPKSINEAREFKG